jgi:hypothetical protein
MTRIGKRLDIKGAPRAALTIGDEQVTVDVAFLNLSPEQQNSTVQDPRSPLVRL